ncbi:ankyrin repeat-containing domain protein [Mycena maculata]|uniref:Ankyrin repeat-containing domain protein n=1 Tax=Mycena maculata TaxID=230809 RepID=A0AAD7JAM4_9AGAR|nr:ankyrin repeat-containing domain protein [Mycena maculata]
MWYGDVAYSPGLFHLNNGQDERTALHWAAASGSTDIARFLIDKLAEVDLIDNSGWTPLHIAVSAGHDEIVQELVGAGADVNKRNNKGLSPLYAYHPSGPIQH